jgi:hypothetical protein
MRISKSGSVADRENSDLDSYLCPLTREPLPEPPERRSDTKLSRAFELSLYRFGDLRRGPG